MRQVILSLMDTRWVFDMKHHVIDITSNLHSEYLKWNSSRNKNSYVIKK